ncbi:hypothetical protein ACOMHN_037376 [Nucella lapillus]
MSLTIKLPITIGTIPSRYALTGEDPPTPCRPISVTPMDGYPAPPPSAPTSSGPSWPRPPHYCRGGRGREGRRRPGPLDCLLKAWRCQGSNLVFLRGLWS